MHSAQLKKEMKEDLRLSMRPVCESISGRSNIVESIWTPFSHGCSNAGNPDMSDIVRGESFKESNSNCYWSMLNRPPDERRMIKCSILKAAFIYNKSCFIYNKSCNNDIKYNFLKCFKKTF